MSELRRKAEAILEAGESTGEIPPLEDILALARVAVRHEELAEELIAAKQCLQKCRQEHVETLTQRRILQIMFETLGMTPEEDRGHVIESMIERARGMR